MIGFNKPQKGLIPNIFTNLLVLQLERTSQQRERLISTHHY